MNSIIDNLESLTFLTKEYANLYLNSSDKEFFHYQYNEGKNRIYFNSIKKLIPDIGQSEKMYDLESPYGYGGPITNCYEHDFLNNAFNNYKAYCKENNIISEFYRFHPLNKIQTHTNYFDFFSQNRTVVIVDTTKNIDEIRKGYSKTTRNIVKKCKKDLNVVINNNPSDFIKLYLETMDKNNAGDFYYFNNEYFHELNKLTNIIYLSIYKDNECISAGFFIFDNVGSYYHLSANSSSYHKFNGNYLLLDTAFKMANEYECQYMLLGGGRTNNIDDSLLNFKLKFSKNTSKFNIGGIIFDEKKFKILNNLWKESNKDINIKTFQQYRVK